METFLVALVTPVDVFLVALAKLKIDQASLLYTYSGFWTVLLEIHTTVLQMTMDSRIIANVRARQR